MGGERGREGMMSALGLEYLGRNAMVNECRIAQSKHFVFIIEGIHKILMPEGHRKRYGDR